MMEFRILELFSGIGGMHYAFNYSQLPGEVAAAIDINTVANAVYAHNHAPTPVMNNNIQSLTAKTMDKLDVNMVLMSPPCQPHTRVGNRRDVADSRSDALEHICALLPQCAKITHVLMENVKGFETSEAHQHFIDALRQAGFYWREFILSPTQIKVPNTRHRYYCIARKSKDFTFGNKNSISVEFPVSGEKQSDQPTIAPLLEAESSIPAATYLQDKVLDKRAWLLDIVTPSATNTMCFTKAYTHYAEGTGSVFTSLNEAQMKDIFAQVKGLEEGNAEDVEELKLQRLALLKRLKLRYFTPREVARLMSFPENFHFPAQTTNKQRYRLLGNSINVCVVGELIKLLCS